MFRRSTEYFTKLELLSVLLFIHTGLVDAFRPYGTNRDIADLSKHYCGRDMFRCGEGDCYGIMHVCDGMRNCDDGSDESKAVCAQENSWCTSSPTRVRCGGNRECINKSWICDGVEDCADGWDERHCSNWCSENGHVCADGKQCIRQISVCDGHKDCSDGSDENQTFCANRVCPQGFFRCKRNTGQCVNPVNVCDGHRDCEDRSDELCNNPVYILWYLIEMVLGVERG